MKKATENLVSLKKLTLNKKTISKLNSKEMNSIVAGNTNPTTKGCATECDGGDSHGCCKPEAEIS